MTKNIVLRTDDGTDDGTDDSRAGPTVASRIAAQTLSRRGPDYTAEVRHLLDAALAVIGRAGSTAKARVADIVAESGLSNDAFYRHFPSKDALVAALVDDGTERLGSYVSHQMAKEVTPEAKVARWVEGLLSQTEGETAAITLAVVSNGSSTDRRLGSEDASAPLGALLHQPFAALGSTIPELHASLVGHAVLGKVADHLWAHTQPTRDEIDHIIRFCVHTARPA